MDERDERTDAFPPPRGLRRQLVTGKKVLVGAVLAAALLWRAGEAVVRGGVELVGKAPEAKRGLVLSEEERIHDALRHFETEFGFEAGELGQIYDVFDTQVQFPDEVVVIMERSDLRRAGIVRISYHLYPTRLSSMAALPADGPPDPARIDEHTWILEMDPGPPNALTPWFDEVARGASFALWRGKGPGT